IRTHVNYQLTAGPDRWHFVIRVHLRPEPGVSAADLAQLQHNVRTGVSRYFNEPGYTLPQVDRRLHVEVQFVATPGPAHTTVTVTPASPPSATDHWIDQLQWPVGRSPSAYAHEIGHYLGVTHPPAAPLNPLLSTPPAPDLDKDAPDRRDLMD